MCIRKGQPCVNEFVNLYYNNNGIITHRRVDRQRFQHGGRIMGPLEHWRVVVDVLHVHDQSHVIGQRRNARVPGYHGDRQPVHGLIVQPVDQADHSADVVHLEVRRLLRRGYQLVMHIAVSPRIRVGGVRRVYRRARGHVLRYGNPDRT